MLKTKKLAALALIAAAAIFLVGCTPARPAPTAAPTATATAEPTAEPAPEATEAAAIETTAAAETETTTPAEPVMLTLEELKAFNGKDGNRAYVAVDGIIYDVTDSAFWKEGSHNGFEAGQDLTQAIKEKSPHGVAKLENVVEIGKIKE